MGRRAKLTTAVVGAVALVVVVALWWCAACLRTDSGAVRVPVVFTVSDTEGCAVMRTDGGTVTIAGRDVGNAFPTLGAIRDDAERVDPRDRVPIGLTPGEGYTTHIWLDSIDKEPYGANATPSKREQRKNHTLGELGKAKRDGGDTYVPTTDPGGLTATATLTIACKNKPNRTVAIRINPMQTVRNATLLRLQKGEAGGFGNDSVLLGRMDSISGEAISRLPVDQHR